VGCRATIRDPSPTCTRSSARRSPGGLIISARPSSDIARPDAGKAQACQQESSILRQPCWAAAGPAPANRNAVCLQNASIGPALACRRGMCRVDVRRSAPSVWSAALPLRSCLCDVWLCLRHLRLLAEWLTETITLIMPRKHELSWIIKLRMISESAFVSTTTMHLLKALNV